MHPDDPVTVFQKYLCYGADNGIDARCGPAPGKYHDRFFHIEMVFNYLQLQK
jgi:hypothetical protein